MYFFSSVCMNLNNFNSRISSTNFKTTKEIIDFFLHFIYRRNIIFLVSIQCKLFISVYVKESGKHENGYKS